METFTKESENFKCCLEDWLSSSNETTGQHLSMILLDTLPKLVLKGTPVDRLAQIVTYIKLIDLIETLGWLEHTSDWDPGLVIELKNGLEVDTGHGYAQMTILGVIEIKNRLLSCVEIPDNYDNLVVSVEMDNYEEDESTCNNEDFEGTTIENIPLVNIERISLYR